MDQGFMFTPLYLCFLFPFPEQIAVRPGRPLVSGRPGSRLRILGAEKGGRAGEGDSEGKGGKERGIQIAIEYSQKIS